MSKKKKEPPLYLCTKKSLRGHALNNGHEIWGIDEAVKELRGHKKLYTKDYLGARRSIVGAANIAIKELRLENIIFYPVFKNGNEYLGFKIYDKNNENDCLDYEDFEEKVIQVFYSGGKRVIDIQETGVRLGLTSPKKIKERGALLAPPKKETRKYYKLLGWSCEK